MNEDYLYRQHFEAIERYLKQCVGQLYAEELAQEVFIKVSKNKDKIEEISNVKAWIYRIATNTAKDFIKSRYMNERGAISEAELERFDSAQIHEDSPEALSITKEMNDCINEFIHRLPSDYTEVLVLKDLEGYKIAEISEELGITPNSVKVRLHRARGKLKDEMEYGCNITSTCDNRLICERK
ncbi:MAG: RNA polymerase sigma factor [Candidatus Thiodiazotropha sp.]